MFGIVGPPGGVVNATVVPCSPRPVRPEPLPRPPVRPRPPVKPSPAGFSTWICLQTTSRPAGAQFTIPGEVPKPPVASGKSTVTMPPHNASPTVGPAQVVVSVALVGAQVNCSPFGFTVVGMKIVGTPPIVAPVGAVALKAKVPPG